MDCSYGFRPKRGCHDAIQDLHNHLYRHEIESVIDVDLANFFGTIKPKVVDEILRKKIGDMRGTLPTSQFDASTRVSA